MTPDIDNKIEKFEDKIIKNRIKLKDSNFKEAIQRVLDQRTLSFLYKLINNKIINEIVGIINQGKEANIYLALNMDNNPVALKIYKIDINSSKWMKEYIVGDPRFKKIGNSIDKIIFLWCSKEYKNLMRIHKHNILCPMPIYSRNNILVMQYIGDKDGTPSKLIKDSINEIKNPEKELKISLKFIEDLYKKAKLVHGDLSEFNILYYKEKQYIIDVSQSISIDHPKALYFLSRDIKNIINFYKKFDIDVPSSEEFYYNIINEYKKDEKN